MAENREPVPPLDVIARNGWLSELVGPVPRAGGPACAHITARFGDWRSWADQREDVAAARAATADDGDTAALKRILDRIEREISDQEHYARMDVERTGAVEPRRQQRIDALVARRQHLRALAAAGFPPPPI
ncbi:MAG TPA: hypothetical protein VD978_18170 [Azospirillum sp.]|nr:hypothetical protein [Azospirillum sp.]